MNRRSRGRIAALFVTLALLVAGCSGKAAEQAPATTLTVYAAASLNKTFTQLAKEYQTAHPGSTVKLVLGGSSDLLTRLTDGAPGDVLATADEATMEKARTAGLPQGESATFATNQLTIVTPPDNPAKISGLADLTRPGIKLVACAPQVPCGAATGKVAQKAGVQLQPVSQENAVTDVLGKVTSGQADAGIVYGTDACGAADKVKQVPIPEASSVVNRYPITVLKASKQQPPAQAFVDLVTGPRGREVLGAAGFGAP